jgi:hypothetical protein
MIRNTKKPHVSAALAQLSHGVTTSGLVVAACAIIQLLVFGFVHFTQVRYVEHQSTASTQPLSVVGAPAATVAGPKTEPTGEQAAAAAIEPPQAPRTLSSWDPAMHIASDIAVVAGVIACLSMGMLCLLGVAVAAGQTVPGVEKATSACCWALALGLIAVPWSDIFASMPFPGVFSGYPYMAWLSEMVDAGVRTKAELLSLYLLMPLAALGASFLIIVRFRAGVAEGIIVTSVSELDERIEREMAAIRNKGVQGGGVSRAVAALNHAIGEKPGEAPAAAPGPVVAAAAAPERAPDLGRPAEFSRATRGWNQPRRGEDEGDDFKRPI